MRCTFPKCAVTAPACGLLGAESLGVLGLLALRRRRRPLASHDAEAYAMKTNLRMALGLLVALAAAAGAVSIGLARRPR